MKISDDELNNLVDSGVLPRSANVDQVRAIADNFDEKAFTEQERTHYEVELWDKKSPINGVPAEEVLEARDDIPQGGEVYLIKDRNTGAVIFFQPHEPGASGFKKITKAGWKGVADKHLDDLIRENTHRRFVQIVTTELNR